MKESIRANLKMIEENIDRFHPHALKFIDKKEVKKYIAIWRWYVSHDYFKDTHPKPEGDHSKPPINWLDAQLKGMTTPLSADIGRCLQPEIVSSLIMEHAARRIHNTLTCIYRYISLDDMRKIAERKYKEKVLDKLDNKKRAEYEKARRDKLAAEKNKKTPEQMQKIGIAYLKKKKMQRKEKAAEREFRKQEASKRFDEETRRLKRGN